MTQHSTEEERTSAYRESARAVAVVLIGFTLQAVSVLPTSDQSGALSTPGFTAFKERLGATTDELGFIAAAGIWGESLALADEQHLDAESVLHRLNPNRLRIDIKILRLSLDYLMKDYRTAVLRIAQKLLEKKIMNGVECGQIILAHEPVPKKTA
jgi:hypothetical protein